MLRPPSARVNRPHRRRAYRFHRYDSRRAEEIFRRRAKTKISSCASAGFTYSLLSRVNRNVTNRTETPSESLITVSLPQKLHSEVVAFQHRSGLNTLSEAIRHALDRYDDSRPSLEANRSRQVSFRVPSELRTRITRQARAARVSVGRIVRVALQALPLNPTTIQKKDIPMAKKKAAAKKSVKKATKAKKK
jgi:predicted HicB family RNase H-like nuclease